MQEQSEMAMTQAEITQIGGGRFGFYWISGNSGISFVKITISERSIEITTKGLFSNRNYVFERSSIQRIEEYSGLIGKGIRIYHSKAEIPSFVVFRSSNLDQLRDAIIRFGYPSS